MLKWIKERLAHKQFSVIIADHLGLRSTAPASLLNYAVPDSSIILQETASQHSNEEIQMWAYEHLTEKQMKDAMEQRRVECDLRRNYLQTTFTDLIMELQGQLNDLQQAQLAGEDDPEERRKLERRIQQLKECREQRMEELDLMMRLTANLPVIVTSALVIPAPVATKEEPPKRGFPMQRDDEVEEIAMKITMNYERSRG